MDQVRRLEFQTALETLLEVSLPVGVSGYVYFQEPPSDGMQYPCIIYSRDNISAKHADNKAYNLKQRYQVTYIDRNPDGDPIKALAEFPLSAFSRHFATSGLNHDVFSIYY